MLTLKGVGFYSYITAVVFGDTRKSVDEVSVHVFLLSIPPNLRTKQNSIINLKLKKQ